MVKTNLRDIFYTFLVWCFSVTIFWIPLLEASYPVTIDNWQPKPMTTWQIQLEGKIDTSINVDVFVLDLFSTSSDVIEELHNKGKKVACHFNAGVLHEEAPDAYLFPKAVIKKPIGDDMNWLDIKKFRLFADILETRIDLAAVKSCDAIVPNYVDGYTNNTGADVTYEDQLKFNTWLATTAHSRGLSVALKNDVEQAKLLEPFFDFAVNEQCYRYNECDAYQAFVNSGKAVLGVEYKKREKDFCAEAIEKGYSFIKKRRKLSAWRRACHEEEIPDLGSAPLDGGWSDWSNWSKCSTNCGTGEQFRTRTCTEPAPQNGGSSCSESDREVRTCNMLSCQFPIDGGWSAWKPWSECSTECGGGIQTKLRTCTNPEPINGGADCVGNAREISTCNMHSCESPIDGGWTVWSAWGACSAECGGGSQTRERSCTNPSPESGGAECSGSSTATKECNTQQCTANPPPGIDEIWKPKPGTTFQWQLTDTVDISFDVDVYDIDLFDAADDIENGTRDVIRELHDDGRKVICYFSAGSWEDWRPDAGDFPVSVKGKSNGWPGERWLDIRAIEILRPIMEARLDIAVSIGCDAVEPDNIDGYTNSTSFPLDADHQLTYNKMLAEIAHQRRLSIGLKNNVDQIRQLEPYFDWALNEQCYQYNECDSYHYFVDAGKAVFGVEYNKDPAEFCQDASESGYSWLKKKLSLNAEILHQCPTY